MPEDGMVWPVPVVTLIDASRRDLTVHVRTDGAVLLTLPRGVREAVIPVGSDDLLCEAVRAARVIANQMGRDL